MFANPPNVEADPTPWGGSGKYDFMFRSRHFIHFLAKMCLTLDLQSPPHPQAWKTCEHDISVHII